MKPAYKKRPVDSPPPSTSQKSPKRRNLVTFQKEENKQTSINDDYTNDNSSNEKLDDYTNDNSSNEKLDDKTNDNSSNEKLDDYTNDNSSNEKLDEYTNDNSSLAQNDVMDNAESSPGNSTIVPNFIDETEITKIGEEIEELKNVNHEKANTLENMKKTYEAQQMDFVAKRLALRSSIDKKKEDLENLQKELSHNLRTCKKKLKKDKKHLAFLNDQIPYLKELTRDYKRKVKEWQDGVGCKKHETDLKGYLQKAKYYQQIYSKNYEEIEILRLKISHAEERIAEFNRHIPKLRAVKNALEAELHRVENFRINLGDNGRSNVNNIIKRTEEEFETIE